MDPSERQKTFVKAAESDSIVKKETWRLSRLFGVSNSVKLIDGGMFLGGPNLDGLDADAEGCLFFCVFKVSPEEDVYFAVYVKSDIDLLRARLSQMVEASHSDSTTYAATNNNVKAYLASNGKIYVRNKGFWDSLPDDLSELPSAITVDKITYTIYPPNITAQRSLLAREFIGYLARFVGREKLHEIRVWADGETLSQKMLRKPLTVKLDEIQTGIAAAHGHYEGNLVEKYHIALTHLASKHFVILTGLSGCGKTKLACSYARAVHGITDEAVKDPLLFLCPVRPDWTDPSGLTGYYDVISNRYIVPTFLQAVLMAHVHPEAAVFVVIDELNLARVEYYLSDVLSCMESGQPLRLHSNSTPYEGSTGGEIPPEVPIPGNLFLTGTINIDETTHSISDKVLDRAVVIDMSIINAEGFLNELETRENTLAASIDHCKPTLVAMNAVLLPQRLGFGYRTIEEAVRYHARAAAVGTRDLDEVLDDIVSQKILVKLKGTEKQRDMLNQLRAILADKPSSAAIVKQLIADLDDLGAFQSLR